MEVVTISTPIPISSPRLPFPATIILALTKTFALNGQHTLLIQFVFAMLSLNIPFPSCQARPGQVLPLRSLPLASLSFNHLIIPSFNNYLLPSRQKKHRTSTCSRKQTGNKKKLPDMMEKREDTSHNTNANRGKMRLINNTKYAQIVTRRVGGLSALRRPQGFIS